LKDVKIPLGQMLSKKFKVKDDFKPKKEKVANIFFTSHMRMNKNICIHIWDKIPHHTCAKIKNDDGTKTLLALQISKQNG
jgi:hypothetical protein